VALVEGRRPGSSNPIAFDEAAWRGGAWRRVVGSAKRSSPLRWLRQRTSEAMLRARCAEDNAAAGRLSAEELRPMLHQDRAGSALGLASGLWSWSSVPASRRDAEAGVLPSSKLYPWSCRRLLPKADSHQAKGRKARRAVRAGIGQFRLGARFGSRLQKLVRRIFLVKTAREATRGCSDWIV